MREPWFRSLVHGLKKPNNVKCHDNVNQVNFRRSKSKRKTYKQLSTRDDSVDKVIKKSKERICLDEDIVLP
jgi:hypothetical protein